MSTNSGRTTDKEYESIAKDAELFMARNIVPYHLRRQLKATAERCRARAKALRAEVTAE